MSLTAYVPLAAVVVNIALTLFVLKAGVQTGTRIAYLIWGGSIAVWNFGTYEMFCVKTADEALAWARFLQIGVIFLPVSLFHLCLQVCGIARRNLIVGAYVAGLCLVGTVFTPYFVSGVRDAGYAWYSVGGAAFWVFTVLYAVLTFSTLRFLWRASPGAGKSRQAQIRSLLWATGILIAGGNNDILTALDLQTGKAVIEKQRLGIGNTYASPLAANGKVYFIGREGTSVVINDGPDAAVLSKNVIADTFDASPVAIGKQLLLRSWTKLYAIEE